MTTVSRATHWRLRTRELVFESLPLLAGIVNVTPDSFSDGGRYFDPAAAIDRGLELAEAGADLLDIGGESTRPGAEPVSAEEELHRVLPVVAALSRQTGLPLSIDTSKAVVAREALAAGAEIINDVSALTGDAQMLPLAAATRCGVCAMHMQGTPRSMQTSPCYDDVVGEVYAYLEQRRDAMLAAGIDQARISLDPGIGFGKHAKHNLTLLENMARFHPLGCPLWVGPSRKRFIGQVIGDPNADRTAGTIGVALALARHGVQIVRVHDVAAVRQALVLFKSAGGLGGCNHR